MSQEPKQPLDDNEDGVSRRRFVKGAVGGVCAVYAGLIGYPVYQYLDSPVQKAEILAAIKEVTLPGAQDLPAGSVLTFKFGPYPAMLIHHADGSWAAFNAVCTHLGCTTQYHPEFNEIRCACHGGRYDSNTGQNIAGPPPRPLTKFKVAKSATGVTVSRA